MFKKKKEDAPLVESAKEPEKVTLKATDNCFERAKKMFRCIGFTDDRHGITQRLAEIVYAYQELDAANKEAE